MPVNVCKIVSDRNNKIEEKKKIEENYKKPEKN